MLWTEKASIDEAYMDFTVPVREKLLERYPELRAPPDDSPLGLDTPLPPAPAVSFDNLGHLVPIAPIETDLEDVQDAANLFSLPSTDDVPSWEAVAISIGAELVHQCRMAVKEELTYTCSAGVARNKVRFRPCTISLTQSQTLAKLCAGWNKPDAQTVLRLVGVLSTRWPNEWRQINRHRRISTAPFLSEDTLLRRQAWHCHCRAVRRAKRGRSLVGLTLFDRNAC
jgi:DNA polymerase eta